jgi:hypothetical protein
MKVMRTVAAILVVGAMVTIAVYAQATPQGQSATPTAAQQDERVTVTGCVARESDYRRARDAGKGGVAGTGVGVGNEFVLTNASTGSAPPASGAAAATPRVSEGTPTGTAGTSAMMAYELTGSNEKQAEQFVGRRVEISGTLKRAEIGAGGPTGGDTAGRPPSGVDVTSKDLKLRELEVATVRAVSGTCPAQ